jgi:choline dehydrogenase
MFQAGPALLELFPSAYRVAQELEKYKLNVMRAFEIDFPPGVTMDGVVGAADEEGTPAWSSPFGIFASTGQTAGAFLRSGLSATEKPDIQLTLFPQITEPHILVLNQTRPTDRTAPAILITIALLNPEGRRTVLLDDHDPLNAPPHLGADPFLPVASELDVERVAWAVEKVRTIQRTPPMSGVTLKNVTPGLTEDMSASELRRWVRDHLYGNSHWCGSARMGKLSAEPQAVVDERLRVRGVDFLRVADASVIPTIPNGNVHSTVLLIASRGSDIILEDQGGVQLQQRQRQQKRADAAAANKH